jgi:hypothetical protein
VIKGKKRKADSGFLTPCSLESGYQCFGGIFRLHLEGSHFNREDRGGMFRQYPLQDYAVTMQKTSFQLNKAYETIHSALQ